MTSPPLWAPWRIDWILSEKPGGCFLCEGAARGPGEEQLVLARGPEAIVLLNRYPYSCGHLMVAPREHTGDFQALADEAMVECARWVRLCVRALAEVMAPDGFNVGLNLGEAAGAGVPGHLHWHIVPRWRADTNFMPLLADTRVIPEHLRVTWRRLLPVLQGLAGPSGPRPEPE